MAQRTVNLRARRRHRRGPVPGAALLLLAFGVGLAAPPARAAGVNVDVRGVDEALRTNVLAYLSFERYKKGGVDLNADMVERLHNRVEREVQEALRPFGYYEPQVSSTVTDLGRNEWRVVVDIRPGRPVLVTSMDLRVTGPGESDPLFKRVLAHPLLSEGARLNQASYEALKSDLQRTAATYGYFDAKLTRSELLVDPPNYSARIALEMQTGERYRFGATTIHQSVIKDSLVRRYLRYHEGDLFDLTQVLRTQFALDDAQYFANLEVHPGSPDPDTHRVPVDIQADPGRRHRYSIGAGYATDTGARATLGFEDHRINDSGQSFSAALQFAHITRYALQTAYVFPVGDPAVEHFALNGSIVQQTLADVTAYTQSAGPSFTVVSGGWQHVWKLFVVRTSSEDLNGTITDRLLVPEIDLASVPKDYLGEPLFQYPFVATLRGSDSVLGSDSNFIQLHLQLENVFHLGGPWHLLLREEVGGSLVSRFSGLPAIYRFFAGGDNSVRGFYFNQLSPTDPVCTLGPNGQFLRTADGSCQSVAGYIKVGGKDVITGTVEVVHDLPRNLGLATFVDYGNAFDHFGTKLFYSAGIGLRFRTPVLTLGVDIAQPLNSPGAGPRLHINFSPKL
ncbi:MAG TPA: BamA/TamA family outer membrane protein [Candidatus Dormibacteraeota bacterium]|nr:BamA/TamA family outer membrane protein [Candidatus Dormibacteraeota bacterium]